MTTAKGKVMWHFAMSLDGFIAPRDHTTDWMAGTTSSAGITDEVLATTGAILTGRRAYDIGLELYDDPARVAYGGAFTGSVFVLTHHPEDARPNPGITFLSGDLDEAVATCLDAANGKNVEIFSADIGRQLLLRGMLDEFWVHVVPVMLGDGVRLLDAPGIDPVRWDRVHDGPPNLAVDLRYRPTRP